MTSTAQAAGGERTSRLLETAWRLYKRWLSPALHTLSPTRGGCGFQPTCSEYATLAVAQHGIIRGGALAAWRVLRCNPFMRGGWDPVPLPARKMNR